LPLPTAARSLLAAAVPLLKAAEPWSLFDPKLHEAHLAAVRALNRAAIDPALAVQPCLDND
jgi:hypothetical protein